MMAGLPEESVQCVVTSPPYWGLRDYGLEPLVWGGREDCEHRWGDEITGRAQTGGDGSTSGLQRDGRREEVRLAGAARTINVQKHDGKASVFCQDCNAWRGSLGLEPTPELFVEHIVEVFREVKRILRKDGVCWVNMGDSYWGGGGGSYGDGKSVKGREGEHLTNVKNRHCPDGLKPKDLCMMPARVALALQADDWWLRSMMPWVKRSAMPESVTDRPASAIEYVFLLSKSARYFFDIEAVRQAAVKGRGGRNPRNTDLFYESLANPYGLILNGDGEPLALDVNLAPFPGAHFATFPPKLIMPLIKAGTSEKGCCSNCGAPWVREVDGIQYNPPVADIGERNVDVSRGDKTRKLDGKSKEWRERVASRRTTGWRPSCECKAASAPCVVLDPFGGSGTVGVVAAGLGRHAMLIDASEKYMDMARARVAEVEDGLRG